jgi:pimeloyl-ACP methyl ester carboxylesterase
MTAVRHRHIDVGDLSVFVREAGDPTRPSLVLLPGYPTDTRTYLHLMDRLGSRWHLVAIDYPGFGLSDPLPERPTFDGLADVTEAVIDALGITEFALYMFDFGAPVGFRIAVRQGGRVQAIVSQNGNAYTDGLGPALAGVAAWWKDEPGGATAADDLVSLPGIRSLWSAGLRDPLAVDPAQVHADHAVISRPGRADYMKALLWDYQTNPPLYPAWQRWLRTQRPAVLAVWGARDPLFVPAGAEAFRRDVPDAEVILLDTGHFALLEEVDAVADATDAFLDKHLS